MLHCYLCVNMNTKSGGGRGILVAVGTARCGFAAAHRPGFGFGRSHVGGTVIEADRRGQRVERDGLAAAVKTVGRLARLIVTGRVAARTGRGAFATLRTLGALRTLGPLRALRPIVTLRPVVALRSLRALWPIVTLRAVVAVLAIVALGAIVVVVALVLIASLVLIVIAILVVQIVAARAPLAVEARLAFAEHAEIMIRILQIIFGLDAVARKLRVARHALIFLEQLGGVAALAIVLAIARLTAADILSPLPTAAAPAATLLTIIDQMLLPYAVVANPPGVSPTGRPDKSPEARR